MKADDILDRASAKQYASWFRALADPTRIQILALLAHARRPMTVGEIVEAVPVVQSTVSHHLKILSKARFVLAEPHGASNRYRLNEAHVRHLPTAADVVMGKRIEL
ncbi:ArsR/SmtB family transcription factor [Carbonactinospora thermoautotrophica]|uniref:ArsR/SmtB family transcription factor n=1 Tax=Carbonactinospora thermoautotrophica TaxID=1469144 RepID=UPI000D179148|nr:metalloregulator ArsR/SmtB family transcription factor [Carbonactinospora thermoautotrophica]